MRRYWIALLALALLAMSLTGAAVAEGFDATPTSSVKLGVGETWKIDTSTLLVAEGQTLKFKTSDKKVAVVSAQGEITAMRTTWERAELPGT